MKKTPRSRSDVAMLEKLAALPEDEIDTKDIPEAPAENWAFARRGEFYKPLKHPVTIRVDADVLAWFRDHADGRGYQTEINRVLRRHVMSAGKQRASGRGRKQEEARGR